MFFERADPFSVALFEAVLAMILIAFVLSVHEVTKNLGLNAKKITAWTVVGLAAGLGTYAAVVKSMLILFNPMPGLPVLLMVTLLCCLLLALSPLGRWLALGNSVEALIIFQAFRLPLELVLHSWAQQGTIPATMTWSGQNFDIASGVLALLLFKPAGRSKFVAWTYNLIGFGLLLNVIRVAIMSSPLPFAWEIQPKLMLAFHLPYSLIVPVCVGGALIGHIVLMRKLWIES
jgi:hypothetical protein